MEMNIEELKKLIHYAVDKASPYDLARYPDTDSFDEIQTRSLTDLGIINTGIAIMWMWINSHSFKYGGKQVSAVSASKCKTITDVYKAVTDTKGS